MPSQWCDLLRPLSLSPIKKLQLAVLRDGLECAGVLRGPKNCARSRLLRREAVAWMNEGEAGPFSFEAVCDALGIDAAKLRAKAHVRKMPSKINPTRGGFLVLGAR